MSKFCFKNECQFPLELVETLVAVGKCLCCEVEGIGIRVSCLLCCLRQNSSFTGLHDVVQLTDQKCQ